MSIKIHLFNIKLFVFFLLVFTYDVNSQNRIIDSLKSELRNQTNDSTKIVILNSISWQYLNHRLDSSFFYVKRAIDFSTSRNNLAGLAQSYNTLAVAYWYKGTLDSALIYIKQAFIINSKLNNTDAMAKNMGNLGMLYDNLGNPDSAIYYYNKSIKYFKNASDTISIAKTYVNLALLQTDIKNFLFAIDLYNKAIELYKKKGAFEDIPRVLANEGLCYAELKEYETSIDIFKEALSLAEKQGNSSVKAKILQYIGNSYMQQEKFNNAYTYLKNSFKLHAELGEEISKINSLVEFADLLVKMGKFSEAEERLQEGMKDAEILHDKHLIRRILQIQYELHFKDKNYEKAFIHLKQFSEVSDSLLNQDYTKQLANFETKYETEKKENRLKLQGIELNKKDALIKSYLILLFVVLGAILVIGWLYIKKRYAYRKLYEKIREISYLSKKYSKNKNPSVLSGKQKELYKKLLSSLEEDHVFKKNDLTLESLTKIIGSNRTEISELINSHIGKSYTSFINGYRVEYAIDMLMNPKNFNITIAGIGEKAGFTNTKTFYRAFRIQTGMTPSQFLKQAKMNTRTKY